MACVIYKNKKYKINNGARKGIALNKEISKIQDMTIDDSFFDKIESICPGLVDILEKDERNLIEVIGVASVILSLNFGMGENNDIELDEDFFRKLKEEIGNRQSEENTEE